MMVLENLPKIIMVFLRGVNCETYKPFTLPYCLKGIRGGTNGYDLVEALFQVFSNFTNVKDNAFDTINNYRVANETSVQPPTYFKLGTVLNVDNDNKQIHIEIKNAPVAICGDGVAVNNKASRLLHVLYGMMTLEYRY